MKNKSLKKLLTKNLLIALTGFFLSGCVTGQAGVSSAEDVHPPLPLDAKVVSVRFLDQPELGGMLLRYEEYRRLEENIIEYRREIKDLRELLAFYRKKK